MVRDFFSPSLMLCSFPLSVEMKSSTCQCPFICLVRRMMSDVWLQLLMVTVIRVCLPVVPSFVMLLMLKSVQQSWAFIHRS